VIETGRPVAQVAASAGDNGAVLDADERAELEAIAAESDGHDPIDAGDF
jgi:hypothetical protein